MLKNKIVLITGASSGIGAACAKQLAKAGAKLLLCARRCAMVEHLAAQLHAEYGTENHAFSLDVRDHAAIKKQMAALPPAWQSIDILINNAGLAAGLDTVQDANTQDWEEMIDTNVKGLLYMTRAVLPQMIAKNVGHIINIGSIAGHSVYAKGVVYCATKHAVKALSEGLRMDLFGTKIRVSSVDPGAVETHFSNVRFKGDDQRAAAVYEGFEPLRADDIADAVVYCATRPPHVNISDMIVMPTAQAAITMISRQ
jgi:NADP-dependent 3-hydroxy acid dehydrogenase YdfG